MAHYVAIMHGLRGSAAVYLSIHEPIATRCVCDNGKPSISREISVFCNQEFSNLENLC